MNAAWRLFSEEIARSRDAGAAVEFWWRDDDAAQPQPALARLLELSARSSVPLALAVVPLGADAGMLANLGSTVSVIQHGTDHLNRAGAEEKKTEFPAAETVQAVLTRLIPAREQLAAQAGPRFVPVLAPPWNRLREALLPHLAGAGFYGVSQFGARNAAEPAPDLRQVNTHADIIAWRAGRGFAGEEDSLAAAVRHLAAKRAGTADPQEATGWLTHHAVHEEAAWAFLERLFEVTRMIPAVRWRSAQELFHVFPAA